VSSEDPQPPSAAPDDAPVGAPVGAPGVARAGAPAGAPLAEGPGPAAPEPAAPEPAPAPERLAILREAYAQRILAIAGFRQPRLTAAFAAVARERFLGPGPWQILRWGKGYVASPDDDPVYIYDDVLVALDPERNLNNGQPSFHALMLGHLDPAPGSHVVHIGAGTGYYSAVIAALVGPEGRVTAIERDAELARRAADALGGLANVHVVHGDATATDFPAADGIYVNAGATKPPVFWLDRLKEGGRLILPLTIGGSGPVEDPSQVAERGAVFAIERRNEQAFAARWLSPVAIFPCIGARDPASERSLAEAFSRGGWEFVQSLHRGRHGVDYARCWLWAEDWCLSYDTVEGRRHQFPSGNA
jgi:protein-L-isoaspartate(D-aspartate) O-methyltransferase